MFKRDPWCGTVYDYDRNRGQWGLCDMRNARLCPGQTYPTIRPTTTTTTRRPKTTQRPSRGPEPCYPDIPTKRGEKCVFPFEFQRTIYTDCVKRDDGKDWCATSANFARDQQWDVCDYSRAVYDCEGISTAGSTSMTSTISTFSTSASSPITDGTSIGTDSPVNPVACVPKIKTEDGEDCVFPFKYNGKLHYDCIEGKSWWEDDWCSLTDDYDRHKRKGTCEE